MTARTVREFVAREVLPLSGQIEAQDFELLRRLLLWAGELGLLMTDVPEEFGGLELDKTAAALIYENLAGQASFQTLCGVTSSIGSLPLVFYGTPEQKQRWLPGLARGELVGCYCLTEPTSGSDALAMRTTAALTPDRRHYLLNGTKQFITNGGIADVFTVFAKVGGDRVTAFLLERGTPGLSVGREEHKMGLRGSSTTAVILEDAMVPVENVLGEVGQGHKIAFNILNLGRVKLGVHAVGNGKRTLDLALAYCRERVQFGRPICEFGAIREKLADMHVRVYATEAATYRLLGQLDAFISAHPETGDAASLAAGEAYRVECALVKVLGSENLDLIVDEALQCFGGYGFSAEYPIERVYRDSRINRIYEGANEINRIFAASTLVRVAGALGRAPGLDGAIMSAETDGPLAPELSLVAELKTLCLSALEAVLQRRDRDGDDFQPLLIRIADLATQTYVAESVLLRARKDAQRRGVDQVGVPLASARVACEEALGRCEGAAREILASMSGPGTGEHLCGRLTRLALRTPADTISLRETIAAALVRQQDRLV